MNSQDTDNNIGKNIIQKQNTENMLRCLAAQRYLYSSAKCLFFWQIMLSTLFIIILSLFNLYKDISWIIAAYGSLIAIFDLVLLSPLLRKKKEIAAKIQELFDTTVLNIEWNHTLVGAKPANEELFKYSEKYIENHKNFNNLRNWYSNSIGKMKSDSAKIICQRSNCVYDYSIRVSFSDAILVVLLITSLFLLFIGFLKGFTLQNFFLLIVFPLLPAFLLLFKTIENNNTSKNSLDALRTTIESVWENIFLNNKIDINSRARKIQDKIFLNRKNNPLIFDWYYNKKKDQLEKEMEFSVDKLVQQYLNNKNANSKEK